LLFDTLISKMRFGLYLFGMEKNRMLLLSQSRALTGVVIGLLLAVTGSLYAEMPLPLDPNYTIPGLVTSSTAVYAIPQFPKQPYGVPFIYTTFGTRLIRIAGVPDQDLLIPGWGLGTWGGNARHHYSKDQPWNSDGTLIAIYNEQGGSPTAILLDGDTYQVRYGKCGNYSIGDDRWHPKYPNIRINARSSTLEWFNVVTCTQVRSWSLGLSTGSGFGAYEGNPSFDGRFAVMCTSNGSSMRVVDMDPDPNLPPYPAPYPNKRMGPIYTGAPVSGMNFDWASVSPSGKYCVVAYDSPDIDRLRVFDINSTTLAITPRPTLPNSVQCSCSTCTGDGWLFGLGHADMTFNPFDANEEVIIGQMECATGGSLGNVAMVRLRDNKVVTLTKGSNEAWPFHISTRNFKRPGWAYVTYWPGSGSRFNDEIIAVKMDGSGSVERLAHTHSNTNSSDDDISYYSAATAVPSLDGRRVIFASNWASNCSPTCGSYDTWDIQDYVIETMPVGDLTHGGLVDFEDLERFLLSWLDGGCVAPDWCGGSDLNQSSTVNLADFSKFAADWLKDSI
jgi:hypothetical protein